MMFLYLIVHRLNFRDNFQQFSKDIYKKIACNYAKIHGNFKKIYPELSHFKCRFYNDI